MNYMVIGRYTTGLVVGLLFRTVFTTMGDGSKAVLIYVLLVVVIIILISRIVRLFFKFRKRFCQHKATSTGHEPAATDGGQPGLADPSCQRASTDDGRPAPAAAMPRDATLLVHKLRVFFRRTAAAPGMCMGIRTDVCRDMCTDMCVECCSA